MVLTGREMHDRLTKMAKEIKELEDAIVVDASASILLCISAAALQIRVKAGHIDHVYTQAYEAKRDKE